MATTWALTAEEIVDQACFNLGLAQMGQSVRPAHRATGLRLLNAILKGMPSMGYLWPKTSDSEWQFVISPGSGAVTLPSDFLSSPIIKIYEDSIKAGFNYADSASDPGDLDTGQSWSLDPSLDGVFGISGGMLYMSSGVAGSIYIDSGEYDGEVGVTLSTNTGAQTPAMSFRGVDSDNVLYVINYLGTYRLYEKVAGVNTVLKSYTTAPANGDKLRVQFVGPAIVLYINDVAQDTVTTTRFFETGTLIGLGCSGTAVRFKNFYYSRGEERDVELVMSGKWQEIRNHLVTADYPTHLYIDPANGLRAYPLGKTFVRGKMQYQAKLDDLVTNTAPDLPADMHLTLIHMVTDELSYPTGRRALGAVSEKKWRERLPEQIAFHVDQGDPEFTYDE